LSFAAPQTKVAASHVACRSPNALVVVVVVVVVSVVDEIGLAAYCSNDACGICSISGEMCSTVVRS
jgi:hypothetical protein